MEERKLTGEELRQKMKEQFKKEMMEDKLKMEQLKNAAQGNKRLTEIEQQLAKMNALSTDDTDDWVAKLNEKSAITEAKIELATDMLNLVKNESPNPVEMNNVKTLGDDVTEEPTNNTAAPTLEVEAKLPPKTLGDEVL